MTEDATVTLAGRMKEARLRAALRLHETVSQARMAELVSKELARTIQQTQWGRYETGENEPPLDVIQAASRVSELPPEYIAFGVKRKVDITADDFRKLTDVELDRADRAAEKIDAERAKKGGKKRA